MVEKEVRPKLQDKLSGLGVGELEKWGLSKPFGAQRIMSEPKMSGIELYDFDLHCWT